MKTFIFILSFLAIIFFSCKKGNPNINKNELITELTSDKPEKDEIAPIIIEEEDSSQDTIVTDARMIGETPVLKDWKNYFLQNNKYSDWDANDPKRTMIGFVVERSGKASNVKVLRSSENEDLDKEAIRLIEEGEFTVGKDINGKYIRTGAMAIVVYFPPQK